MANNHTTRPLRALSWSTLVVLLAMLAGNTIGFAQSADPATPIGEAVAAGPWQMTLVEVLIGEDAANAAASASDQNPGPGDGLQYIAAHIAATNNATVAMQILPGDFGVVGSSGIVRRNAGVFAPSPELNGLVQPGETLDGWILSSAESDATDLVLQYDSTTLSGTWADHTFAISDSAGFQPSRERAADRDRDGRDPGNPVGPDRVIATADWTIKIVDVVTGAAVNDISPEATQRLAQSYVSGGGEYAICLDAWVAIQIEATNNGDDGLTRYMSATAFQLADIDGSAVLNVRSLTAPDPDLSGDYAAGATRTGWIAFEKPSLCKGDELNLQYDADLLRFQPFRTTEDVRYLTWDGEGVHEEPTEAVLNPDEIYPVGTTLVVSRDATVNLRTSASTNADIRAELDEGTEVEVTGEPTSAGGYVWYPVQVVETGDEGWIAQDFVEEP